MKIARKDLLVMMEIMVEGWAKSVTKYYTDRLIVRMVRKTFKGCCIENSEILVTIGIPNYKEREFIKKCKKLKEPLPVKKLQIVWLKK
jgi:hypothetical protein